MNSLKSKPNDIVNTVQSIPSLEDVALSGTSSAIAKNKLLMNTMQDHSSLSPQNQKIANLNNSAKDIDTKRDPALNSSINQSSKGKIGPFDTIKNAEQEAAVVTEHFDSVKKSQRG